MLSMHSSKFMLLSELIFTLTSILLMPTREESRESSVNGFEHVGIPEQNGRGAGGKSRSGGNQTNRRFIPLHSCRYPSLLLLLLYRRRFRASPGSEHPNQALRAREVNRPRPTVGDLVASTKPGSKQRSKRSPCLDSTQIGKSQNPRKSCNLWNGEANVQLNPGGSSLSLSLSFRTKICVGEEIRRSSAPGIGRGFGWTGMEQKQLFLSALSVGVGVGVGLGLASGQTIGKWAPPVGGITAEDIEQELMRQVVDAKDGKVTFDEFPYFLSEQTRVLLTSAAYVHLRQEEFSKHTRNLSPASRAILLSGAAELYSQMLAKALAHYFEAKLLLLDTTDFSLKIQSKYGTANKEKSVKRSTSETALKKVSSLFGSFSILAQREEPEGGLRRQSSAGGLRRQSSGVDIRSRAFEDGNDLPKLRRNASASADMSSLVSQPSANPAPLKRTSSWAFDEKLLIQSLYKVLVSVCKRHPIILYLRDVENLLYRSKRVYSLFQKLLKKLSGPVLVLGSRLLESETDYKVVDECISVLFPYNIEIKPPKDESHLVSWKAQLEEDMKMLQFQDNRNHITEVLAANDLDCDDLGSICVADTAVLSNYTEEIIVSAISYHLMNNKDPEYRNGKLVISSKSLSHGLSIFQERKLSGENSLKLEAKETVKESAATTQKPKTKVEAKTPIKATEPEKSVPGVDSETVSTAPKVPEVSPDNEFEKRIRPEVIPANKIGVTFDDIGSLDEIKESLQELVMLPIRRPDLFVGGLLKPCKGILLFGPPGTGKTMLAKAIANEAGASFINVSMSTITSKWFGEDEKNVRALFTLAAKVSPTIIFVDEVDSMLGQRTRAGEHEAMRKIKNEFMTHWDGLLTKPGERILVLAATNRPFDLDEAIIRRFERRIMVGLPAVENREQILRNFLSKEKVEEGLDFKELAVMTEGYSGSDLKNLCTTAAYRPVRELIQREKEKELVCLISYKSHEIPEFVKLQEVCFRCSSMLSQEKRRPEKGRSLASLSSKREVEDATTTLRPLNMEDIRQAKNQIAASFASEGSIMSELKQWNELYGDGGSRKKQQLSYFL